MIGRREFAFGASIVATLVATMASSCPPPLEVIPDASGLSRALLRKDREAAISTLAKDATLAVINSTDGIKFFSDPTAIVSFLYDLVHEQGYEFLSYLLLDSDDGPYWQMNESYGWQYSALVKPFFKDQGIRFFVAEACDQSVSDSYNVLVSGTPINTIALIRNDLPPELKLQLLKYDEEMLRKQKRG